MKGLDLFAGARGWDIAAREMGWEMDGVEIMEEANATAEAEGFVTVAKDVRTFSALPDHYVLGLASPSCKRYSAAGNGAGRRALDRVLDVVRSYSTAVPMGQHEAVQHIGDEDAALVVEPLRVFTECVPVFIALEQTPAALPVWQAYADVLRQRDYSVAVGVLNAEQYGVPQTRRRAVLVARRDGVEAGLPRPTHSRYYPSDPRRLDPGVLPWVSMAEALGWDPGTYVVSNYGTGGDPANRGVRTASQPSATVTSKADRMKVHMAAAGITGEGRPRPLEHPSPTITGKGTACWMQGADRWRSGRAGTDRTTVRQVEPEEAATLQGFPDGYRFQGTKTRRMEQIGNAVPRLLARAIISTFPAPADQAGMATGSKPIE